MKECRTDLVYSGSRVDLMKSASRSVVLIYDFVIAIPLWVHSCKMWGWGSNPKSSSYCKIGSLGLEFFFHSLISEMSKFENGFEKAKRIRKFK